MMRSTFKYTLWLLGILLILNPHTETIAQTPSDDPHWILHRGYEFGILDRSSWTVFHNFDHYASIQDRKHVLRKLVFLDHPDNVRCESGMLIISLKRERYSCPDSHLNPFGCSAQAQTGKGYEYTSGYVRTTDSIQFGFLEARIKSPNVPGFNTAFWTFSDEGFPYNEIDIFELLPGATIHGTSHDENVISSNIHWPDSTGRVITDFKTYEVEDYTEFHRYGLEWTPDKLIFYIDGKTVRITNNPGIIHPSNIILNIGFSGWLKPILHPFTSNNMYIDWLRLYKLNMEGSATNVKYCDFDFAQHENIVRRKIQIGGLDCRNELQPGQGVVLRATEGVRVEGDFEVPLGAKLYIDVNQGYE